MGLLVQEATYALGVFADDPPGLLTAARRLLNRQPALGALWWMASRLVASNETRSEARDLIQLVRNDQVSRELSHALPDDATVVIIGWPEKVLEAVEARGDIRVLVVDVDGQAMPVVRRLDRMEVEAEAIDPGRIGGAVAGADLVILDAAAIGPSAVLGEPGMVPVAATAKAMGKPVWLAAGVGDIVPEGVWQSIVTKTVEPDLNNEPWVARWEVLTMGMIDRIVTGSGVHPADEALRSVGSGAARFPHVPELLR